MTPSSSTEHWVHVAGALLCISDVNRHDTGLCCPWSCTGSSWGENKPPDADITHTLRKGDTCQSTLHLYILLGLGKVSGLLLAEQLQTGILCNHQLSLLLHPSQLGTAW